MQFFISSILLLALGCVANGATISRTEDSYQNLPVDGEQDSYQNLPVNEEPDIKENLIQDEDAGDIVGLLPPRFDAKDYFPKQPDFFRESSYDMDSEGKKIRFKGEPEKEVPLTPEDELAMKQITAAFEKLMKEAMADGQDPTKPIVIMADDGKGMEVEAVDDKADQVNVREETPEETTSIPSGEPETFTTDDSSPAESDRSDDDSDGLLGFFHSIWDVVQESVSLAARMLTTLGRRNESADEEAVPETTAVPDTTSAAPVESTTGSSSGSSVGPVAAFEEPRARHSLPAHEFDNRRDIDSLLYGRGIA